MKTMELERFNVSELTKDQQTEIIGGGFWKVLGQIFGILTFGLIIWGAVEISN